MTLVKKLINLNNMFSKGGALYEHTRWEDTGEGPSACIYAMGFEPLSNMQGDLIGVCEKDAYYDEEEDTWFSYIAKTVLFSKTERLMLKRAGVRG